MRNISRVLVRVALVALFASSITNVARADDPAPPPAAAAPATTTADVPPPTQNAELSSYEKETLRLGLERYKAAVEQEAEGRIIDEIEIVSLDVFEERDVMPAAAKDRPWAEKSISTARSIANKIHWTSKDFVIRREVLMHEGEPYKAILAEETARNLRALSQLSTVVVVPVASKRDPKKVTVLVVTKDVWSLRLNWNLAVGNGGLQELTFQPQERNVFGYHHTASTYLDILPLSYTLGVGYSVPRFGLTRIGASAAANVIMNQKTGSAEGSAFSASVGQPLFSALTEWAWNVSAGYSNSVFRRYTDAQLSGVIARGSMGPAVPYEYRIESGTVGAAVTRSFGWKNKFDLSFGFGVADSAYRTVDDLSRYDANSVKAFQGLIPIGENRVGPSVTMQAYTTDFQAMHDFVTLALEEDYRLGHNVIVKGYRASKELGSTRDIAGAYGGAQYTLPFGDGIVRGSLEGTAEQQMDRGADTISDASIGASFKVATPRFRYGRFVFQTGLLDRERNYLNSLNFLGGSGGLRGYPTNYYVGKDVYTANLEFRSRPVQLLTAQVGFVAFHDMGDAFNDFSTMRAKHSVGGGIRVLFPELDRAVFRLDLAFPFDRTGIACNPIEAQGVQCAPTKIPAVSPFFTFGQAFDFTTIAP